MSGIPLFPSRLLFLLILLLSSTPFTHSHSPSSSPSPPSLPSFSLSSKWTPLFSPSLSIPSSPSPSSSLLATVSSYFSSSPLSPPSPPPPSPLPRYSHSSVLLPTASSSTLLISHGYRFSSYPQYFSDVWTFPFFSSPSSPPSWHCHHSCSSPTNISDQNRSYPRPRYGAISTWMDEDQSIILHGGDNGGYHNEEKTHKYFIMNDMWKGEMGEVIQYINNGNYTITPPPIRWSPILSSTPSPSLSFHSAISLSSSIYVFGGLIRVPPPTSITPTRPTQETPYVHIVDGMVSEYSDEMWKFEMGKSKGKDNDNGKDNQIGKWRKINVKGGIKPPGRIGHSMAAVPSSSSSSSFVFYIFGGFVLSPQRDNMNDLWRFHAKQNSWESIAPSSSSSSSVPSPRGYHSLLYIPSFTVSGKENAVTHQLPSSLMVFGGATCDPGCKCHNDIHLYDIERNEWKNIPLSLSSTTVKGGEDVPWGRYKHIGLWDNERKRLVVNGGESFMPYSYWNDVWEMEIELRGKEGEQSEL